MRNVKNDHVNCLITNLSSRMGMPLKEAKKWFWVFKPQLFGIVRIYRDRLDRIGGLPSELEKRASSNEKNWSIKGLLADRNRLNKIEQLGHWFSMISSTSYKIRNFPPWHQVQWFQGWARSSASPWWWKPGAVYKARQLSGTKFYQVQFWLIETIRNAANLKLKFNSEGREIQRIFSVARNETFIWHY